MPVLGGARAPARAVKVHHLFTHALIAHPDVAFADGNEMAKNYDADCITPEEFKEILRQLYKRNFRLVDVYDVCAKTKTGFRTASPKVPQGCKPLVLSFDDINYYRKKMYMGMADKLVLENGRIGTYSSRAKDKIRFDNDVVPILENFIAAHPDFSVNGARGVLNLTGFDGILGYRTDRNSKNRAEEIAAVKPLVAELKRRGWRFASHSYGHYHMTKISDEKFFDDAAKWKNEVQPLVGETPLYVYPYGEYEKGTEAGDMASRKHRRLLMSGFRFFFGVGGTCCRFENTSAGVDQLFMDRVPLDGNTMRRNRKVLAPYFDVASVYDSRRPSALNAAKR